ncbi:hypothetical protein BDK51DRAFT_11528, partial [Blyttiomyces helicus]
PASEFVECSKKGTVRVWFACQPFNKAMNACLGQYTTEEERDKIREAELQRKI